mmetsp:Transcript_17659/g.70894  ORF Transcript_17659/g.70894 Transcript_17659/m.70894 type:complete len:254 (-) Transcript_17659:51-812(-)
MARRARRRSTTTTNFGGRGPERCGRSAPAHRATSEPRAPRAVGRRVPRRARRLDGRGRPRRRGGRDEARQREAGGAARRRMSASVGILTIPAGNRRPGVRDEPRRDGALRDGRAPPAEAEQEGRRAGGHGEEVGDDRVRPRAEPGVCPASGPVSDDVGKWAASQATALDDRADRAPTRQGRRRRRGPARIATAHRPIRESWQASFFVVRLLHRAPLLGRAMGFLFLFRGCCGGSTTSTACLSREVDRGAREHV